MSRPPVTGRARSLKDVVRRRAGPGLVRRARRLRRAVRHGQQRAFDRRYGLDTATMVLPEAMGPTAGPVEHACHYEASWRGTFRRMVGQAGIDPAGFAFVDMGSGKGAVLLYASEYPFRSVTGVEHSRVLCDIATRNLERFPARRRRCRDVSVRCMNGLDYDLPGEPFVLYLSNPFGEPLMGRFLAQVERSLRARPVECRVLSFNPATEDALDRCGWLEPATTGWNHAVYRSRLPADTP